MSSRETEIGNLIFLLIYIYRHMGVSTNSQLSNPNSSRISIELGDSNFGVWYWVTSISRKHLNQSKSSVSSADI